MNELQIIAVILPILFQVAAGWLIVRMNLLKASDAEILSTVFLYVCAPALIIDDLSKEQLASLIEPRFILATIFLLLVLFGGLFLVHFVLLGRKLDASAFAAFAGTKFNAVIIGLPILTATVKHHAIVTMTINLVAGYVTILPLTLIMADISKVGQTRGTETGKIVLKVLCKALCHPLILSTALGLLLAGAGVRLPGWLDAALLTLGGATIPIALLAVGMSLSGLSLRENAVEIVCMSSARMILSPILAVLTAQLLALPPVFAVALVVSFSLPTAKMVLPLANEHKTYVNQSAGIIAVTTASLVVVWPVVIWICEHLWPGIVGGLR